MSKVELINKKDKKPFKTLTQSAFVVDKQRYLTMMHLNGLWLRCDCVPGGAIAFVKRNNVKFVLVNHAIEGKHHLKCKLHTDISGEINAGDEQRPHSSEKPPVRFTPLKLTQDVKERESVRQRDCNSSDHKKSDRIHSLLSHALTEKSLNALKVDKAINLNALFYSKMFALTVSQVNKHKVKVSDITYVLPNARARNYQANVQQMQYKFAEEVPLQCNFIYLVDDLQMFGPNQHFTYQINGQQKSCLAMRQIHHYQRTSGPRIVFLIKALIEQKWQNYLAYSHPIVDPKHPVLIDSNHERNFALYFLVLAQKGATLTKPYLSCEYQGNHLLPDFIYSAPGKKSRVIEVMGMLDQKEYRERKSRLVPLMEKRYKMEVIEVEPQGIASVAQHLFADNR